MLAALSLCRRTVSHLNHRGYIYVWANVFWFLLTIPIITAPAAWAGLVNLSRQSYLNRTVTLDDFWAGFRMNVWRGMVMVVLNIVVIGLNLFNLGSYANATDFTTLTLRSMWWLTLVIWLVVQFYMWPLFYELKKPTLWGALRNAFVMAMLNPLFTIVLMVVVALLVAVSTFLFPVWAVLTGSALAALSTDAVLDRLIKAGLREPFARPELESSEDDVGGMNIE